MTDKRLEDYQKAKLSRKAAEEWNELPNGKCYQNDKFNISIAHCKKLQLTRSGQQYSGGTNYWETKDDFNLAILEHIVDNWGKIFPDVIERMKDKENKALNKCQSFIDEMQEAINEHQ